MKGRMGMMHVPREVGTVFQPLLEEKDRTSGLLLPISQQSLAVVCHLSKASILKEPLLISQYNPSLQPYSQTVHPLLNFALVAPNCKNTIAWKRTASKKQGTLPDNN
jgi:hypothetical protein